MRDLDTLQRVVKELKKNDVTLKELSSAIGSNYNYLTRIISGNTKYSSGIYDGIMKYARNLGIDTTVYATRSGSQPEIISAPEAVGFSAIVNLRVKIQNNKITGVEWDLTQ